MDGGELDLRLGPPDVLDVLTVLAVAMLMPAICLVVYSGWAALAGALGDRLGQNPRLGDVLRWVSGIALIALGAKLALDRR